MRGIGRTEKGFLLQISSAKDEADNIEEIYPKYKHNVSDKNFPAFFTPAKKILSVFRILKA